MAEPRSDVWIWALVVGATVSVVALAVAQGNRSETKMAGKPAPEVALPLLGGGKSAIQRGKVTVVDVNAASRAGDPTDPQCSDSDRQSAISQVIP